MPKWTWNLLDPKRALVTAAVLSAWVCAGRAEETNLFLGNYHDSPVYYETHPTPAHLVQNGELLHQDKLKLRGFPVVDMTGWNWKDIGIENFSWWIQVEELRFLLPLLKSGRAQDRQLARRWFNSWYETHLQDPKQYNKARWREPMSAAYRGMVLVYFLKTEETRDDGDEEIATKLREVIHVHQEFLADPKHFDGNSNHGMVEAFGLLEVTRVFPDTQYEILGLDRMLEIVERSVSKLGTHKEHSPGYHFVFWAWLDQYSAYLIDLPHLDEDRVLKLIDYNKRMEWCSYYLHDHDGSIPEIGDVDSMNVFLRFPSYNVTDVNGAPRVFFDAEAGYAIYKSKQRYLVFAIQNIRPELRFHYHNDVLSVYYRYRGETILGDPGKYEYTRSNMRTYFMSMQVHNTVFPPRPMGMPIQLAKEASYGESDDSTRFTAVLEHRGEFVVTRNVVVPHRGGGLTVIDDIAETTKPGVARPKRNPHGKSSIMKSTPRGGRRKTGKATWNFGYDVESVVQEVPAGEERVVYSLTTKKGRRMRFSVETTGEQEPEIVARLARGQSDPRSGWYSPSLFVMRPCYTLTIDMKIDGPFTMVTRLEDISRTYFPGLRILFKGY